jgi:hypothetical protein
MLGDVVEQLAIVLHETAEEPVAQPRGASDDRVEDRLHIGLRLADDAQDLGGRRLPSMAIDQLSLQLLDHATKILICTRCRHFGRHGGIQSFEYSAKMPD